MINVSKFITNFTVQKYSLTLFGMTPKKYTDSTPVEDLKCMLCEKIVEYSKSSAERQLQLSLFDTSPVKTNNGDIRIVELFAGVGAFVLVLKGLPLDLKLFGTTSGSLPQRGKMLR